MNAPPSFPNIDVAERFDQAIRAGQPKWLWFEIPETRWAEAVATIETTLREMLASGRSDNTLLDDPIALSIACYTSGTGPLLGSWIEQGKLTTTAANAEILGVHWEHNRARMAQLTLWASEAVDALSAGGVAPILLKGMHTAHKYFDEPGQRIMSDIDLLLRPDELPIAARILMDLGYGARKGGFLQRSWVRPGIAEEPVTLTYVHRNDPWSIDLHEGLTRKLGGGSRVADIDALVPTVASEAWHVSRNGGAFPPPLLLVHLLTHASCFFDSLTLQRQYEISLVIRKNDGRNAFDWSAFEELCDRVNLWPFLYPALYCVAQLSARLIPDPIISRSRNAAPIPVRKLIESLSPASAHRVGRWSWTERYMWADGMTSHLRQFLDELKTQNHLPLREVMSVWRRRSYNLLGIVSAKKAAHY